MSNQYSEIEIKQRDLNVKIVGISLTLVTIIIGLFQYFHSKSYESNMEFRRNMWQKQLEVYSQVTRYAGLIAMNPTGEDFDKNVKEFGGLYWGEMILIEDQEVEKAMKDFYLAINDFNPEDSQTHRKLKFKADQLAKACRISSERTWQELK